MRQILHVDMDAFYASVEQRDDPALRGKPVIVGARSRRGVVTAASYEARPFGVRSAMSVVEAMRRCPQAIVVLPRHAHYVEVSKSVFAIFHRYTPLVEGLSLDEAFLDVTGSRKLFGSGEDIARQIKRAIYTEMNLVASSGVAPSKFIAKIASDLEKPDGLVVVREGDERAFLAPLSIERMWGVGPKAAGKLHAAGFDRIGDLADASPDRLEALLGSWGRTVYRLARGEDAREVVAAHRAKSIGAEETFARDLRLAGELETHLLSQSSRVAARLFEKGLYAWVVTVKLKYRDHRIKTRQQRLEEPAADTDTIYRTARSLLGEFPSIDEGVRLTGVAASDFGPDASQRVLFEDPSKEKYRRIEAVTAELRTRFGAQGIRRGRLLDRRDRLHGEDS